MKNNSDREDLQLCLDNFSLCCDNNYLKINVNKCSSISFNRSLSVIKLVYNINYSPLKSTLNVKDLGVIFSSNLLFDSHLDYICGVKLRIHWALSIFI